MSKLIGQKGENIAKNYLLQRGWFFLFQNWRYGHKEIDLIFKNKIGEIIFVEVKTRSLINNNSIFSSFSGKQNNNIKKAALNYCLQNKINLDKARFDLIIIEYKDNLASLKHYSDIN